MLHDTSKASATYIQLDNGQVISSTDIVVDSACLIYPVCAEDRESAIKSGFADYGQYMSKQIGDYANFADMIADCNRWNNSGVYTLIAITERL